MTAYTDWATLPDTLAERIARSRLLELARKNLGINKTLPESAAIDATIIEALATANNGPPVVADDAALAVRFPLPLNDQLAQVKAAGYTKRYDQAAGAWRPEGLTYAAGPVVSIVAMGAIGDGSSDPTSQAANRKALRDAYTAVAAGGGGQIYAPKGTYNFGADTQAIFTVTQGNIALVGDGLDVSTFIYSSSLMDGFVGPGSFGLIGNYSPLTDRTGFVCEGLTFSDTFTSRLGHTSHQPAALDIVAFSNVLIRRCRFFNIKGNSAINLAGNSVGATIITKNFSVVDCIFDGTSAGGWIEGDGVNWVNAVDGIYMIRNTITGAARHGFEGGAFGIHVWCVDNIIDMTGPAADGVSNCAFGSQTVAEAHYLNNKIYGLKLDQPAFFFDSDIGGGSFLVDNIDVIGNRIKSTSGRGVQVQNTGGFTPVTNIRVRENIFELPSPVVLLYTPGGASYVNDNLWISGPTGSNLIAGGNDPFHSANDSFDACRNIIRDNGAIGRKVIDFGAMSNFNDKRFRAVDNHMDQPFSSQSDGETFVPMNVVAALADGARSPVYTVTIPGVRRGDEIDLHDLYDNNPWHDGMIFEKRVSADNQVKLWYLNKTGVDLNGSSISTCVRIRAHRYLP